MAVERVAFITIGQSPRNDILDEMRPWWRKEIAIEQYGALDGLPPSTILSLAPRAGEARLVSRLRDGSEVVLRESWVHERVKALVEEVEENHDLIVLLCTGRFPNLRSKCLLLAAQSVVDHGVASFCEGASTVGVLLPHQQQMEAFHYRPPEGRNLLMSYASPYVGNRLSEAARELSSADFIVMHSMGYSEAMRQKVMDASGKPVLLARRMVASVLAQLL